MPEPRAGGFGPVLLVLALSAVIGVVGLVTATGVTRVDESTYRTEHISTWWWSAFGLVPVAAYVCRWARPAVLVATWCALVLPHVVVATVVVARYRAGEWASGLEVFAYLHPLVLAAVAAALLPVVRAVTRARARPSG